MEFKNFAIFIGIAVLVGSTLLLKYLKKDKSSGKIKDAIVMVGIGIAMILFIASLFMK